MAAMESVKMCAVMPGTLQMTINWNDGPFDTNWVCKESCGSRAARTRPFDADH